MTDDTEPKALTAVANLVSGLGAEPTPEDITRVQAAVVEAAREGSTPDLIANRCGLSINWVVETVKAAGIVTASDLKEGKSWRIAVDEVGAPFMIVPLPRL